MWTLEGNIFFSSQTVGCGIVWWTFPAWILYTYTVWRCMTKGIHLTRVRGPLVKCVGFIGSFSINKRRTETESRRLLSSHRHMQEWTNRKLKKLNARPLSLPVASDTPSLPVSKYGSATPQELCSRHGSNGYRKDSSEWHTDTPTHTHTHSHTYTLHRSSTLTF